MSVTSQVIFDDGVQGISGQTAVATLSSAGTIRMFLAHQHAFGITGAGPGGLDATIYLVVQPALMPP